MASEQEIEARFLKELRHHLLGWKAKVISDFSDEVYNAELAQLSADPVYSAFALNNPMYVLIRLMGRMSISIGRRLGEIYDKVPRFVVQARYDLTKDEVAPKMGGKLELDICIPYRKLNSSDKKKVIDLASRFDLSNSSTKGLGIEIRYNFNPNDSSRLRKDEEMARLIIEEKLIPVYLIFSSISPRDEAIERLKRAGWHFIVGEEALVFMRDLCDSEFDKLLKKATVQKEILQEVTEMMSLIRKSTAFKFGISE